jgi:hypothetical protein
MSNAYLIDRTSEGLARARNWRGPLPHRRITHFKRGMARDHYSKWYYLDSGLQPGATTEHIRVLPEDLAAIALRAPAPVAPPDTGDDCGGAGS